MANSRDFVRSDTLLVPWLSTARRFRCRAAQFARQTRHLNRAKPSLKSLVAALQPRAVDGLLQSVASQHAKHDRYARIHLRKLQPARRLRANIIVMRSFPANHASDRDQGVVPSSQRKF